MCVRGNLSYCVHLCHICFSSCNRNFSIKLSSTHTFCPFSSMWPAHTATWLHVRGVMTDHICGGSTHACIKQTTLPMMKRTAPRSTFGIVSMYCFLVCKITACLFFFPVSKAGKGEKKLSAALAITPLSHSMKGLITSLYLLCHYCKYVTHSRLWSYCPVCCTVGKLTLWL